MPLRPRREIAGLKACPHGGINYAELKALGLTPEEVLDFSVSTNPYMPPPGIKEMLGTIAIEQYPDSEATELRQRLSEKLGIPPEYISAGNGTTELMGLIATTYFRKGDSVLILEPTYGEYETACRIAGARILIYRAVAADDFAFRIEEVTNLVRKYRPRAIFICNPNNPTGKYLSREDIEGIMDAGEDSLLILDEAYVTFITGSWNLADLLGRGNVVVLRSMTKDYGLPGLRLGYALAHPEVITSLRKVTPPWNVNIIAQKVGIAVLEKEALLRQSLCQVREAKEFLVGELSRLGFKVLPSDAHYFLIETGNAQRFRSVLLKYGIMVRDCTSFGLPEYVRIAPRTMPECQKLITALNKMLKSGEHSISGKRHKRI